MPDVKGSMLMLLIKRTKPPQPCRDIWWSLAPPSPRITAGGTPYGRQFSGRDHVPGGRSARCCLCLCGLYSDIWM